jgi:DNA-directed RNA polymerase specialized sigma24 family protein
LRKYHGISTVLGLLNRRRSTGFSWWPSNRLEFVGGAGELSSRTLDEGWVGQVNTRLELARIVRTLRDQHGAVLMLRAAGYEWEDVGQILGKSAAAVRISFCAR